MDDFGGEYRFRIENIDEPAFGLRPTPDFTAIGHRALLHADWRSPGRLRLFVQLGAAAEQGREPVERGFDQGALDVTQAFADLALGASSQFGTVRSGRTRSAGQDRACAVVRRPSRAQSPGAFDDDSTPGERFLGAYLRAALPLRCPRFAVGRREGRGRR